MSQKDTWIMAAITAVMCLGIGAANGFAFVHPNTPLFRWIIGFDVLIVALPMPMLITLGLFLANIQDFKPYQETWLVKMIVLAYAVLSFIAATVFEMLLLEALGPLGQGIVQAFPFPVFVFYNAVAVFVTAHGLVERWRKTATK